MKYRYLYIIHTDNLCYGYLELFKSCDFEEIKRKFRELKYSDKYGIIAIKKQRIYL